MNQNNIQKENASPDKEKHLSNSIVSSNFNRLKGVGSLEPLQAALLYLHEGMCPIPAGRDKTPLIPTWKEYQKRLPAEGEVREWWTRYPKANIALICGHGGLVVLDIDVKGQPKERKELADRIAADVMGHAKVVSTPSGGYHIYLIETDEQSKGGPLPGIGDLQTFGKYVLVPPSTGYVLKNELPPLLVHNARGFVTDFLPQYGINFAESEKKQVNEAVLGIPEGTRNNTLARIGGFLRSQQLSQEAIEKVLLTVNSNACNPPLPDKEIASISKSISRYPVNFTSNYKSVGLEVKLIPILNAGDLQRKVLKEGKTIIKCLPFLGRDGYIPEHWTILLAGFPKVGKTELIATLIKDWMDLGMKILYISEEPQRVWEDRLVQRRQDIWDNTRIALGINAGVEPVVKLINESQEVVVIIDTIRNVLGFQDENSNSEVANVLNPVIEAGRKKGVTLILLHHLRKGGGKYGEGISGGHGIFGAVDVGLEICRDENSERRRLVKGLGRIITIPELLYEMADDKRLTAIGNPKDITLEAIKERITDIINCTSGWVTTKNVLDELDEPRPSKEQVRLALTDLAKGNTILRDPDILMQNAQGKSIKWATKKALD